jgi:tartrate dehydratase alpha subunit/fumarate hydratase class I-like protein
MKRVDVSGAHNINMIAMGGGMKAQTKLKKSKKAKKENKTKSHSVSNFVYHKIISG